MILDSIRGSDSGLRADHQRPRRHFPPGWGLLEAQKTAVVTDNKRRKYQASLQSWFEGTGLNPDHVQWIEYEMVRIPRVRYRFFRQQQAGRQDRGSLGSDA